MVLVGDKMDLSQQRNIDPYSGELLARDYGFDRYMETSSLLYINVNETVDALLIKIHEKNLPWKSPYDSINLTSSTFLGH